MRHCKMMLRKMQDASDAALEDELLQYKRNNRWLGNYLTIQQDLFIMNNQWSHCNCFFYFFASLRFCWCCLLLLSLFPFQFNRSSMPILIHWCDFFSPSSWNLRGEKIHNNYHYRLNIAIKSILSFAFFVLGRLSIWNIRYVLCVKCWIRLINTCITITVPLLAAIKSFVQFAFSHFISYAHCFFSLSLRLFPLFLLKMEFMRTYTCLWETFIFWIAYDKNQFSQQSIGCRLAKFNIWHWCNFITALRRRTKKKKTNHRKKHMPIVVVVEWIWVWLLTPHFAAFDEILIDWIWKNEKKKIIIISANVFIWLCCRFDLMQLQFHSYMEWCTMHNCV